MEHTVLQFDYEDIYGTRLAKATGFEEISNDDGTKAYKSVRLMLSDGSQLYIRTTDDTDELIVEREMNSNNIALCPEESELEILNNFLGLDVVWCWVGINWRGYKDIFMLSFEDTWPQIAFVASSAIIHCYKLTS